jgi:hypothetical protein
MVALAALAALAAPRMVAAPAPVGPARLVAPEGCESFFPVDYTAPRITVGNGGAVVITGPTPIFRPRAVASSSAGMRGGQASTPAAGRAPKLQDGNTELMWAAATGDAARARALLEGGADPNARNRFGSTALMGASTGGHAEILRMLLGHGASPDLRGKADSTALMFAAKNGQAEAVVALLEGGASVDLKDAGGRTAEALARERGFSEIADALGRASVSRNPRSP